MKNKQNITFNFLPLRAKGVPDRGRDLKWFTLTELILGVSISAVVLLVVFSFMANVMNDFWKSRKKTEFITNFYSFTSKLDEYKAIFNSGAVINNSWWTDALFLYTPGAEWVLFWIVDKNTLSLDTIANADTYGPKHIWYKELTTSQVSDVLSNSWAIYGYDFFRDKIFSNIYIKDFQITPYNTTALFNVDVDILIYYRSTLDGSSMNDIVSDDVFSTVLTF